jgi:uncharacterized membrane protein
MSERPDLSHAVFVHFYRAVVGHMDVWRQRMDATTNWAAATTAAMIAFSFSNPDAPHFILLLAIGFNFVFLLMESRRYQIFDLWRRRFRVLNRYVVAPVLAGEDTVEVEAQRAALAGVAVDLGRLVPHLRLFEAMGYRIRRNYAYLFAVAFVAWLLKLEVHPTVAERLPQLVERAAIGGIPGPLIFSLMVAGMLMCFFLALRAPSEQMHDWAEMPSPLQRFWPGRARGGARGP